MSGRERRCKIGSWTEANFGRRLRFTNGDTASDRLNLIKRVMHPLACRAQNEIGNGMDIWELPGRVGDKEEFEEIRTSA
jgi:hypothetical protein